MAAAVVLCWESHCLKEVHITRSAAPSPFGSTASNGITSGIKLFHRVYAEGDANSNVSDVLAKPSTPVDSSLGARGQHLSAF